MIWLLYNLLFAIGFTLMMPRFIYRMLRRGGYARDFGQRLGFYTQATRETLQRGGWVWIHAVSVGEIFIALKLMKEWRARQPDVRFLLSTTTSTAGAIVRKQIAAPDAWIYFPVDFSWVTRRVLALIKPSALVLVELELWPNLVRYAKRAGVSVFLVNGRISDHSFRGYKKVRAFTRRTLPLLDALCVQSDADAERLIALGARRESVRVMGTAKYDVAEADADGEAKAREALAAAGVSADAHLLLGGSTWPGEEAALLDAYRELREQSEDLVLLLAPRHAERSEDVVSEIKRRGLNYARRTAANGTTRPDIFLLDTTGELKNFFACADVIFIGKSLTQHGGQNIIEPALYGKPIIVGPNMENFAAVVNDFLAAGALVQVQNAESLKMEMAQLLGQPGRRAELGRNAARVVREKGGALSRTLDVILPIQRGA